MATSDITHALSVPFALGDLEWKVQTCGEKNGKAWALIVPYLSARAIADRLDAVVGPENWRPEYVAAPSHGDGMTCRLSLRFGAEWVAKEDGTGAVEPNAGLSTAEAVKGTYSNAFKRVAQVWGIGRYLYFLDAVWADVHTDRNRGTRGKTKQGTEFRWDVPKDALPLWARPDGSGRPPEATQTARLIAGDEDDDGEVAKAHAPPARAPKAYPLDGKAEPADALTLASAQALVLKGKALGEMSDESIRRAVTWAIDTMDEQGTKPHLEKLKTAGQMILTARANSTLAAPLKTSKAKGTYVPPDPDPTDSDPDTLPKALQDEDDTLPF